MIIGFNGKMGVGKSTALEILKELYPNVTLVKFAGPLYEMQEFIYNRISSAYKRPDNFIKDRKLLQWLGTEFGRNTISETLWVDIWKSDAQALSRDGRIVVCDDVRFDNEAEAILGLNGYVINISSDKTDDRIDTRSGLTNHASEAGIRDNLIHFKVKNNGTLEEYRAELCRLFDVIKQSN